MLTKTQALKSLPDTVHLAVYNLYLMRGKDAAAEYLKHEICKRNPGVKFAGDNPRPVPFKHVEGTPVDFQFQGIRAMAMQTKDGKVWVARAPLCRAIGFDKDAIGRLSPRGDRGKKLAERGFSFDAIQGKCKGNPRSGMYFISSEDARIAVEVLTSLKVNRAA